MPWPPPSLLLPRSCKSEFSLSPSFLRPWLLYRCQTISLVFCKLCYNYILQRSRKQAQARPLSGSSDQTLDGGSEGVVSSGGPTGHESTVHQECWPVLVICDAMLFVSLYIV